MWQMSIIIHIAQSFKFPMSHLRSQPQYIRCNWMILTLALPEELIICSSIVALQQSRVHHDWQCIPLQQQQQQTVGRVVSFYAFPQWGISQAAGRTGPIKKPALLIRADPRCTATLSMNHCPPHNRTTGRCLKKKKQENSRKDPKENRLFKTLGCTFSYFSSRQIYKSLPLPTKISQHPKSLWSSL